MKKISKLLVKLSVKLLIAVLTFVAVTFLIYFFNLDMKLTSAMEPMLLKWYDHIKRDQHL